MLALIKIHDPNEDHEVGGQDFPFLVTAQAQSGSINEAIQFIRDCMSFSAFNVQPSSLGLANHIEFSTFESEDAIYAFFGLPTPRTDEDMNRERFSRVIYARTVGELKAAIANLPDNLPLVHAGVEGNDANSFALKHVNRLGVVTDTI